MHIFARVLGRARNRSGYVTLFLSAGRHNVIILSAATITESEVHSTPSIYRGSERERKSRISGGLSKKCDNFGEFDFRFLSRSRCETTPFFSASPTIGLAGFGGSRYSDGCPRRERRCEITCSRLNTHVFPSDVLIHWIVCYRSSFCARFDYASRARSGLSAADTSTFY